MLSLIISKIVYFFISPHIWLLLTLGVSFSIKSLKWKKRLRISALVIALVFSNTVLFKEAVRLWEVHSVAKNDIKTYDVGIVLGGMFEYDNSVGRLMGAQKSTDRIWQTLDLYHSNKINKICISGGHGYVFDRGLKEAIQLKEQLVSWGIPEGDIIVETASRNTYENAKFTAELVRDSLPEMQSFLLITSSTHIRRAKACFEKQKLPVDVYPTDQFTEQKRSYHWDEFIIPSSSTLNYWFLLNKEIVGYLGYLLVGNI